MGYFCLPGDQSQILGWMLDASGWWLIREMYDLRVWRAAAEILAELFVTF
jgi:hypothetical protein